MSTRSALFIQTEAGDWLQHYCHFDGYPRHMMAALAKADPDAILAAKELRQILDTGEVEGFPHPRAPEVHKAPAMPDWADHAYVLTSSGWEHAASDRALQTVLA